MRGHFGATAKKVSVRTQQPWYWRYFVAFLLLLAGYLVGYWQFAGSQYLSLLRGTDSLLKDKQTLEAQTVYGERQLQVERAAQKSLADELAALQDEGIQLKEELAFYQGILNENSADELKLHSFKLNKTRLPNQYEYHVMLIQSGRHDKIAQGQMALSLNAIQQGEQVTLPLTDGVKTIAPIKFSFKYYQRIDGSFDVPEDVEAPSVAISLLEAGSKQVKISQQLDLPD